MFNYSSYKSKLERLKGQKESDENRLVTLQESLKESKKKRRALEKALTVVKKVGISTQEQLSYNVSEIVSLALNSIMDNPYDLKLNFVERRGRTECDFLLERDGIVIDPYDGGGGVVDTCSFALRVAMWTMENPNSRNVLILDEPFKHLKGELPNQKMLTMVEELCSRLNLQVIMVSDERVSRDATIQATDKLFETRIRKGITKTKVIKE